jgi:glycosyltransferase involved in cell wall biosynthesis
VGGCEPIVALLDEMLVNQGHRSIVVGCRGSKVSGMLVPTPAATGHVDAAGLDEAHAVQDETLERVLDAVDVDVVHMHGVDVHTQLPEPGPSVLVTLHLSPFNYPDRIRRTDRALTHFNCVSRFSRRLYPTDWPVAVIANGVPLDRFRPGKTKENYTLALGRICREKGFHLAIDAAKRAGLPLLLGGSIPPFAEEERYFEEEIRPRLDDERRFIGAVPEAERIDLLARARCVVVPSLVEEGSSVVALEALASGTPVVARPVGGLPENIEHGRTGLFAYAVEDMARALLEVTRLDPRECRLVACERFSAARMAASYLELYKKLAAARLSSSGRDDAPCGASRLGSAG